MPNFKNIATQTLDELVQLKVISISDDDTAVQSFIHDTTNIITTGLIEPLKDEFPEEQTNPLYHN